jgi:hypothetical protein
MSDENPEIQPEDTNNNPQIGSQAVEDTRIVALEAKVDRILELFGSKEEEQLSDNRASRSSPHGAAAAGASPVPGNAVSSPVDIQDEYRSIKDSFQRVRLPSDLKIDESKQGVKRGEQAKCNIITRSASYSETMMKILLTVKPGEPLQEELLNDLLIVCEAHLRYLQEERALVLVNSSLGDNVGGIYRHFRKNTSAFPPDALDALTAAVSLSAATNQNNRSSHPFRGRPSYSPRSSRPWRGGFRQNRIPSSRDNGQQQYNSSNQQDFQ